MKCTLLQYTTKSDSSLDRCCFDFCEEKTIDRLLVEQGANNMKVMGLILKVSM